MRIKRARNEMGLETVISYLLIVGVLVSLLLEITGAALYYGTYHNLAISSSDAFKLQGRDFFSFIYKLVSGGVSGGVSIQLITAGIVVLLLTPFLRVVFSMLFFAWEKNYKFTLITLFVLVVLTISLTLH
jgi:uncharacterized membrane protein